MRALTNNSGETKSKFAGGMLSRAPGTAANYCMPIIK